ncbi:MAG: cobalamin-dependent protein [Deltaproteobacteria bacterium]|nr:cobalamin-dependent protein [Deltaproteobacteria bacterium]MBW2052094.1 cobalamin-dependent protein [Deltaproteobacteria bacterium]MBW2140938.1 cobalamin-dependent protein [Deltaproteobacteria bacterium]MBW2324601.1 cobalamin-dependent protein [Deltaproteobacteria bacterium]
MGKSLAEALVKFDEDAVLGEVTKRLDDGESPMQIIRDLQNGMGLIGEHFNTGEFFLSELLMSADLFARAMEILEPRLEGTAMDTIGRIVIGTPKGDLHDIGKNIFCTVAKAAGFEVHDLGVDVPVKRFVEAVEEVKPQILAFSALLTTAFNSMKGAMDLVTEKGLRDSVKVIVGGGVVTETVMNFIGADGYTTDAMDGLRQCQEFLKL